LKDAIMKMPDTAAHTAIQGLGFRLKDAIMKMPDTAAHTAIQGLRFRDFPPVPPTMGMRFAIQGLGFRVW
jgi:hypothetical protein